MTNKTPELDLEVPLLPQELELEVEQLPLNRMLQESPTENPDPIDIWK